MAQKSTENIHDSSSSSSNNNALHRTQKGKKEENIESWRNMEKISSVFFFFIFDV